MAGDSVEKLEDVIVRSAEQIAGNIRAAKEAISTVIFGQDRVVENALVTILSGGHALLIGDLVGMRSDARDRRYGAVVPERDLHVGVPGLSGQAAAGDVVHRGEVVIADPHACHQGARETDEPRIAIARAGARLADHGGEVERGLGGCAVRHDGQHHLVHMLGDLAGEGRCVVTRLVDHHRQRRLQGVGQIADVRAGALDDLLVGFEESVELVLQRFDLLRQAGIEADGLARADGGEPLLHLVQRQQAEADLEQGDGKQANAGQRQRQRQAVSGRFSAETGRSIPGLP